MSKAITFTLNTLPNLLHTGNRNFVDVAPRSFITETDNGTARCTSKIVPSVVYPSSSDGLLSSRSDMQILENRLKSFDKWPNQGMPKEVLANAGFYYFNYNDVVRCAFCNVEGHKWVAEDKPMDDHKKWNPNCPFVRQSTTSNGTFQEDTCGRYGIEVVKNSLSDIKSTSLEKLGVQKCRGPAHPEYSSVESRLRSFSDWPKSMKQKPYLMAEAGYYYCGVGDQTICFYCGGGLKDWEENDDPFEQHALWFPKCSFLILKMGQDFIEKVQNMSDTVQDDIQPSTSACNSNNSSSLSKDNFNISSNETAKQFEEKEKTLCKICFKNDLGVVFLPCGHIVACVDCASALKKCAVCRKPVEASVRAFLS